MSEGVAGSLKRMPASQSIVATDKARELRRQGRDIIMLTAGEPDFDTPAHVKAAAVAAIERGETRYPPVDGIYELKEAVCEKFKRDNDLEYDLDEVIVSNGAKQTIFNAFMATLNAGDRVLCPAPYWVSYPAIATFAGAEVDFLPTRSVDGFKIDPQELHRAITPHTRWLILNSPNNPSGACYSAEELQEIARVLEDHPQVLVLSDDIYEHLLFDDLEYRTLAQVAPELRERTLTVNGVSKAYAMTGWRIGYAGGPRWLIRAMRKLQSQSTGGSSSIAQHAAVEALRGDQAERVRWRTIFQRRRDLVCQELSMIPGLKVTVPRGAFYVFPSCGGLIGAESPKGHVIRSDLDFTTFLLEEAQVAGVHGEAYGLSPHIRLSFATSEELLRDACKRIAYACSKLA